MLEEGKRMRIHIWLCGLFAAWTLITSVARADIVAWDPVYLKQLQAEDKLILVEFTSYR
jgi:hypothetical protein